MGNKNIKQLQDENEKLRNKIKISINELIENEIQQEKLCTG